MKVFSLTKVPQFMTELFSGTFFDDYQVNTITIKNGPSTVIEGRISDGEDGIKYCSYSSVKRIAYECVKGKNLPDYMKFVLTAPKTVTQDYSLSEGESFSLTLSFRDNELTVMSGAFLKDPFSSRETEKAWDNAVEKMFSAFG